MISLSNKRFCSTHFSCLLFGRSWSESMTQFDDDEVTKEPSIDRMAASDHDFETHPRFSSISWRIDGYKGILCSAGIRDDFIQTNSSFSCSPTCSNDLFTGRQIKHTMPLIVICHYLLIYKYLNVRFLRMLSWIWEKSVICWKQMCNNVGLRIA